MNLSYSTVYGYTLDIKLKRGLSKEKIKKIRKEILNGKSKIQTAKENNVSYRMVLKNTVDISSDFHAGGWNGIRGKSLEILQILLIKGYYICDKGETVNYRILKKYFPAICKVYMYGKNIIFLEDKSNIAIKEFLSITKKRNINFHEVSSIIKTFNGKIDNFKRKELIKKTIYRQ